MPIIDLPTGFVTRPEASKTYNRSKRALERDLERALATQDVVTLAHWKLVTKDGKVREAGTVTTEQVDTLVAEGMVPTWCVEEDWLQATHGTKESPRPATRHKSASRHADYPSGEPQPEQGATSTDAPGSGGVEAGPARLPGDVEFLKERIRVLEQEKHEETARNERREGKLFAELEVKNKQIAAWDEISQGLTKALATGQITPALPIASTGRQSTTATSNNHAPDNQAVKEAKVVQHASPASAAAKKPGKAKRKAASPTSKRSKSRPPAKAKSAKKRSKSLFEKHAPTFHKAVAALIHRP